MKRINEIRYELRNIQCEEATKLWRLARRVRKRGCSDVLINRIRLEAHRVNSINPEDLLNPFINWEFAFKI